jgi:hypothetical protein
VGRVRAGIAAALVAALLVAACGATAPASPSGAATSAAPTTAATTPAATPGAATSASPPAASPSASARPSGAAARVADLAYLVERLKAIHPNPFLDEGEAAFMARVARIEGDAPSMTDAGFVVAVMDLMGHRLRDGHSGAWAMAQAGSNLHAWPIWLWDFPDGPRVLAAREPYGDLVGARVTAVGGASIADARAKVASLVPRDNASSFRSNLPIYLTLPEVLGELGLIRPGDPGLTLELLDGSTRTVAPEPLPMESFRDWIFGAYGGRFPEALPPDVDGPLYLQHRDLAFWSQTLTDPAGFYVGYNEVTRTGSDGRKIEDVAAAITAAAKAEPDRQVVIDLRNNGGGDNNSFLPLKSAVNAVAHAHPGRVSMITGRATFSAAGNFVTDLMVGEEKAGIHLVGESPGGGLDMYGDVRVVTLPNSGIVVLISSRYHVRAPGDTRLELTPDKPIEVTWADYAAGRDPVLAAALRP